MYAIVSEIVFVSETREWIFQYITDLDWICWWFAAPWFQVKVLSVESHKANNPFAEANKISNYILRVLSFL